MKHLIIITIMLFAVQGMAQKSEFLKLYSEYKSECDSIVIDTITEDGTVKYNIVPDDKGDIKLIPLDTVWEELPCSEFKENSQWLFSSDMIATYGYNGDTLISYTANNLYYPLYSEQTIQTFKTETTRQKYCKCKLREATFDGFWEWLKEKGYRE